MSGANARDLRAGSISGGAESVLCVPAAWWRGNYVRAAERP